jgi:hypothetical protein
MKLTIKILNAVCLILWSIQLFVAIGYTTADTPVNPVLYLLTVSLLILHYIKALVTEE